ncbi:XkdX family protein [Geobacillus stearothermophilus]
MLTFEKIKSYYDSGFWTKEMVGDAVVKGKITHEQYREITGEEFTKQ